MDPGFWLGTFPPLPGSPDCNVNALLGACPLAKEGPNPAQFTHLRWDGTLVGIRPFIVELGIQRKENNFRPFVNKADH